MADSSVEQAKKQIVAALQKLRSILIESPEQEYPGGLREHPWVMKEWPTIKRALCKAGMEPGHPGPRNLAFHVGDFLYTVILPWTRLPLRRRDREVLDTIDDYIEELGGQVAAGGQFSKRTKARQRLPVSMTEEDKLILDTLADSYPAAINQPDHSALTGLPRPKISERLKWLEANPRRYVERPKGTKRKGHAITPVGLSAIGRPVEPLH